MKGMLTALLAFAGLPAVVYQGLVWYLGDGHLAHLLSPGAQLSVPVLAGGALLIMLRVYLAVVLPSVGAATGAYLLVRRAVARL